jgi:fucose permease
VRRYDAAVPPPEVAGLRPNAVLRACYTAMFVQAMAVNLTPLLFVTLQAQFGLSFEQVGRLVLINFTTQLLVDIGCAAIVDRVSAKLLAALGNGLAAVGLWTFALAPFRSTSRTWASPSARWCSRWAAACSR